MSDLYAKLKTEKVFQSLCEHPKVWKTHGVPSFEKEQLIKEAIQNAIQETINDTVK